MSIIRSNITKGRLRTLITKVMAKNTACSSKPSATMMGGAAKTSFCRLPIARNKRRVPPDACCLSTQRRTERSSFIIEMKGCAYRAHSSCHAGGPPAIRPTAAGANKQTATQNPPTRVQQAGSSAPVSERLTQPMASCASGPPSPRRIAPACRLGSIDGAKYPPGRDSGGSNLGFYRHKKTFEVVFCTCQPAWQCLLQAQTTPAAAAHGAPRTTRASSSRHHLQVVFCRCCKNHPDRQRGGRQQQAYAIWRDCIRDAARMWVYD